MNEVPTAQIQVQGGFWEFRPQPNITPYELALCLGSVLIPVQCGNASAVDMIAGLRLHKHFRFTYSPPQPPANPKPTPNANPAPAVEPVTEKEDSDG